MDRKQQLRINFLVRINFLAALVMLIIQFLLGMALFVAALMTLVSGIQTRRRGIVLSSAFGFIGILGAGFNGGSFLNYHQDFSSMIMATGFAIAVVAYSAGLYLANETTTSAAT